MTYMIRQMGHVAFYSPDPENAAQDLVEIVGMRITERDGDTVYLSSNDRHHEISFTKGGSGTAIAIGLEAVSVEAVDEVKRRAQSDGLEIIDDKPSENITTRPSGWSLRVALSWKYILRSLATSPGVIMVSAPIPSVSNMPMHSRPTLRHSETSSKRSWA